MSNQEPHGGPLTLAPALAGGFVVLMAGPDGQQHVRYAHQDAEACLQHLREAFCPEPVAKVINPKPKSGAVE